MKYAGFEDAVNYVHCSHYTVFVVVANLSCDNAAKLGIGANFCTCNAMIESYLISTYFYLMKGIEDWKKYFIAKGNYTIAVFFYLFFTLFIVSSHYKIHYKQWLLLTVRTYCIFLYCSRAEEATNWLNSVVSTRCYEKDGQFGSLCSPTCAVFVFLTISFRDSKAVSDT